MKSMATYFYRTHNLGEIMDFSPSFSLQQENKSLDKDITINLTQEEIYL